MARAGVLMEEIREEMRLGHEEHERGRAEMRLSREQNADLREFIREQTAVMRAAARGIEASSQRSERKIDAVIERLDDIGDQIRANTQTVLTMLDRLAGNGGAAGAPG